MTNEKGVGFFRCSKCKKSLPSMYSIIIYETISKKVKVDRMICEDCGKRLINKFTK